MWEPRRPTTLWAFTACYRDSFTLTCTRRLGEKIAFRFIEFISTEKAAYKMSKFCLGLNSSLTVMYRADSCEANYRKSTAQILTITLQMNKGIKATVIGPV
jgi:hypothetical protein